MNQDDEVSGYAYLMFTTGGEESAEVRRHHESLVNELGQWLTARQLEWSWRYEDEVWVAGYLTKACWPR